jgi:hypothetical protein
MKLPVSGGEKKLNLPLEESPLNIPLDDSHHLLDDQAEPGKPVLPVQLKTLQEQDQGSVQQQQSTRLTEPTVSP